MKTVLILSYYFPPMVSVGGRRAFRLARYLPRYGWRPAIFSADAGPAEAADPAMAAALDAAVPVCRGWLPRPIRLARDFFERQRRGGAPASGVAVPPLGATSAPPGRGRGGLVAQSYRWLEDNVQRIMPLDDRVYLVPHVVRQAVRLGRRERAAAVMATSSPFSALLAGRAVARALRVPLVLDLRDPWSLNFFFAGRPRHWRVVDTAVERSLFRSADRVVFAAEAARAAYLEHYPWLDPGRVVALYTGFDPSDAPPAPAPHDGRRFRVVHFGHFYGKRDASTLLRALRRLCDDERLSPAEVGFVNLGRFGPRDRAVALELGLGPFVTLLPTLPYGEGLAELSAASLLLLETYGAETLFVPQKLFDYALVGRPVLALTRSGEVRQLIERTGMGESCDPADEDAVLDALERAYRSHRAGSGRTVPPAERPVELSCERLARCYAALLDGL